MKKALFIAALCAIPLSAFCSPTTDIQAGLNIVTRVVGGGASYSVPGIGTGSIPFTPPGANFNISKATNSLNLTGNTATLFPGLGISTTIAATGAATSNGFTETFTTDNPLNSGWVGKSFPVTVKTSFGNVSGTFTVSSFKGTITEIAYALPHPVLDSFNHVYRSTGFYTYGGSVVFQGTASVSSFSAPATVTVTPLISGLGGVSTVHFVKSVSVSGLVAAGATHTSNLVTLGAVPASLDTINFSWTGPITSAASVGATTLTTPFSFTAGAVSAPTPATITASDGTSSAATTIVVQPLIYKISPYTTPIYGGTLQTFIINFSQPAAAPFTITVHSDNPEVVITPTTVSIPVAAGKTYVAFTARIPVGTTSFTLDVSGNGTTLVQAFTAQ